MTHTPYASEQTQQPCEKGAPDEGNGAPKSPGVNRAAANPVDAIGMILSVLLVCDRFM
jgi:hypothetical protein